MYKILLFWKHLLFKMKFYLYFLYNCTF